MSKTKNVIWRFFTSVKLALLTLIILAASSILGTLIKQGQSPEYYVQEFGHNLANVLAVLDIADMYSAWWFLTLLALFSVNLVACSLERLPLTWRIITRDNLDIDLRQLENMQPSWRCKCRLSSAAAAEQIQPLLAAAGWKNSQRREREADTLLLFSQQGAWTRLGVFAVHLGILVIIAGALIGKLYGFKAYVFLPEGRSTTNVFLQGSAEPVPLGFELHCDKFETLVYTSSGGIRGERSTLTVLDLEGKEVVQKSIVVNEPLSYQGITFYKANGHPLEEYFVVIRNQTTGAEQAFRVPAEREVNWPDTSVFFKVEELQRDSDGVVHRARLSLTADTTSPPLDFWVADRSQKTVGLSGKEFTVSFRQLYTTLLLATKDPGVGVVSLGALLMVLGLLVCLGLSHRRIWLQIAPGTKRGCRILVSGASNKSLSAFEQRYQKLVERVEQQLGE